MNRALPSVHGGSLDITRTVPLNKHLLKILRGNNFVSGVKVAIVLKCNPGGKVSWSHPKGKTSSMEKFTFFYL